MKQPGNNKSFMLCALLVASAPLPVIAQTLQDSQTEDSLVSFRIAPTTLLDKAGTMLSIARDVETQDMTSAIVDRALDYRLGLEVAPIEGLSLNAQAWRSQLQESALANPLESSQSEAPALFLQNPTTAGAFNIDNPLVDGNLDTRGFDIGASYSWETNRFGEFTLSTTTTYVDALDGTSAIAEMAGSEVNGMEERLVSSDLQSSLKLSWKLGNHTASAITNYFDSFNDLSDLDIEEINDLVENITTVDLEYGYSMATGSNDRAIISFGIQNVFDEKTAQILNSSTRILDQNGRVAYGRIKYQF